MSIKQRLNVAERKAGIGSDVDIIVFRTVYDDQKGNAESETAFALISAKDDCHTLSSTDDETREQFNVRVEAECRAIQREQQRRDTG
jgi:hypothetical protein